MKYRSKPVIKEAKVFDGGNHMEVVRWMLNSPVEAKLHRNLYINPSEPETLSITTLEGTMKASKGDYIIKGLKGEFYPCKPDIFEASYEKVEE